MSHKATNWAIEQRGLKPATKIVLWHLCDRHNPDHGCFPSQDQLAQDCEISRASLNRHLDELERRGLVSREARRDRQTRKQLSTRYHLAFEEDFEPADTADPCPELRHGNDDETVSQNVQKPCLKNDETRVSICDTNPVREPVREPVIEKERVSGRENTQDPKAHSVTKRAWQRRFRKAHAAWPTVADDSPKKTEAAWFKLSEKEREAAAARQAAYLHHVRHDLKRTAFCRYSVYLSERRWERLPKEASAPGEATEIAKPFGKDWGAFRFARLSEPPAGFNQALSAGQESWIARGLETRSSILLQRQARSGWPRVNTMHEDAMRRGRGVVADPALAALAALFVTVRKGSDLWHAWQALHLERGWPWLPDNSPEWVWMPAPPQDFGTYASPLEAVRAAIARFETGHANLTERQAAE
ncbi:MarR family protein [Roseibium album]|nr:MarR family protein [Roseibium album]